MSLIAANAQFLTSVVVTNAQGNIIETAIRHDGISLNVGDIWSADAFRVMNGEIDVDIETVLLSDLTLILIRTKPTDALTGAQSRAQFDRDLASLFASPRRDANRDLAHDFAMAMCDINRLKRVNDQDGHLAGDALLKEFVANLQRHLRQYDTVYRFGGDEFAIIFRHINRVDLLSVLANRLREATGEMAAIGLAHASEATSATALIALADERLYENKRDYL